MPPRLYFKHTMTIKHYSAYSYSLRFFSLVLCASFTFCLLLACRPDPHRDLAIEQWQVVVIPDPRAASNSYNPFKPLKKMNKAALTARNRTDLFLPGVVPLSKLLAARQQPGGLILNFYSPICEPCVAELPALQVLYQRARAQNVAMFLALEMDLTRHGLDGTRRAAVISEKMSQEQIQARIAKRMQQDIRKYNIQIPTLIIMPPFQIGAAQLIRATPETLFIATAPLRLKYNFVGALTHEKQVARILGNTRFQFAVSRLQFLRETSL